jgi:MFS transporter, CP family, cyanate transporter
MSASIASRRLGVAFVAALALVSLNMRTVFASLPPLLDDVRDDLGLSAAVAGLLTTGPVLCFGLFALAVPELVRRIRIELLIAFCAGLTALGAAARGAGGTAGLFAGTLLAGAAVAVAQTVVPILVRVRYPRHTGLLTGVFSAALTIGAALAAATAVPLSDVLGGWEPALAAYAIPAVCGLALWLVYGGSATIVTRGPPVGLSQSGRSWSVAVFFGLQSMAFYAGLTWLPSILRSYGYSDTAAGGLQAFGNAVQFVPALAVPLVAGRRESQTLLLVVLVAAASAGFAGLLAAPRAAAIWVGVVGLAQGGTLGLALVLPVLRGRGAHAVAGLTAMTLAVGYLIAAAGPSLVGLAHDLAGGWNVVLVCLIAITLAEFLPGVIATRSWTIGAEER